MFYLSRRKKRCIPHHVLQSIQSVLLTSLGLQVIPESQSASYVLKQERRAYIPWFLWSLDQRDDCPMVGSTDKYKVLTNMGVISPLKWCLGVLGGPVSYPGILKHDRSKPVCNSMSVPYITLLPFTHSTMSTHSSVTKCWSWSLFYENFVIACPTRLPH